ncbi:MAG: protein-glutamate O-methyltransferase CheR [bacterium]|nr:protein-glutamate O-methyltransferase CheR [bacterium]
MFKINEKEYGLMKGYIEKQCGIHLEQGKEYLIETRLSDLVLENGCTSFEEFYNKASANSDIKLRDRIVDAMTTNETLWFRDASAWEFLRESAGPQLLDNAESGEQIRIWSAASSTGQEAYSFMIMLSELARARGKPQLVNNFKIIGTDISSSALFLAIAGRYDSFAVKRGMPDEYRDRYFKQEGNVWVINQEIKNNVSFKKFNLQDDFTQLGYFDMVLCRYVTIYFDEFFKKEIYKKIARVLKKEHYLLLGATESLRGFSDDYSIKYYKSAVYNEVK